MSDDIMPIATKDVFVSHAWGDKPIIEPLVNALEGAGLSCWYDLLELHPGQSLLDAINEGLSCSKVVLFCLSEKFLEGNWTPRELNAAYSLSTLDKAGVTRLVPLMMTNPEIVQRKYPLQFADKIYIKWDATRIDHVVNQIRRVIAETDSLGGEYWYEEALAAYQRGDYVKAALNARKAVDASSDCYPGAIIYVASMLQQKRPTDAYRLILSKEDKWHMGFDDSGADVRILDYVQDSVTEQIVGNEIEEAGFTSAILHFLATDSNTDRCWRYIARLFDKEEFSFHHDKIVAYVGAKGREHSIDWLRSHVLINRAQKARDALANILYIMAAKLPTHRDPLIDMALELVRDEHEEVRAAALPAYYHYARDGEDTTVRALRDRAPLVRITAFNLLAGLLKPAVNDEWISEEAVPTTPARVFGPEVVIQMLNDPDELVFDAVVEMITDEKLECPSGIDLENIKRPSSSEAREALVKKLSRDDSAAAHQRLRDIAANDPSEFVRREALEALEGSARDLSSDYLRTLWSSETVFDVKDALASLILKKGNSDIPEIYLRILERSLDSSFRAESAFEKLANCNQATLTRNAIDICATSGKLDVAASALAVLLQSELMEDAERIVRWCLDHEIKEALAILSVGLLPSIPVDAIEKYLDHHDPGLRADCCRAREYRLRSGKDLEACRTLYRSLQPKILERDNLSLWGALEAIDGVIEFGTPLRLVTSSDNTMRWLTDLPMEDHIHFVQRGIGSESLA